MNINFLKSLQFILLLTIATVFVGCEENTDTEAPFLNVSAESIVFGADGQPTEGSQASFDIETNRDWTIDVPSETTWVTLSQLNGNGKSTIQVSIPEGINGEATIIVKVSNKIGALLSETVTIRSGSVAPKETIYSETVGSAAVASPYPYVNAYTAWNKTGVGSSTITYSGQTATVRASGLANTGAYLGASGPNVVFFGTLPANFVVNKITLKPEYKNLELTFGASYSFRNDDGSYNNTFDATKFEVALSRDGSNWTPVSYTKNSGDQATPYWVLATANFTLKEVPAELYIRFTALDASAFRLDDITLSTGNGGSVIELPTGGSVDPQPEPEPEPTTEILNETFAANQGNFTIANVTLPSGSTYVWQWDAYKYMKASSFVGGGAKDSEGWLISPAMNLTGKTSATLSFDHAGKFFTASKLTEQAVLVSSDYTSGAPSSATWTPLTIAVWPSGNDWTFVNSGNISLSSVAGRANVRIAFKYASTTAGAATWEIKNVIVK